MTVVSVRSEVDQAFAHLIVLLMAQRQDNIANIVMQLRELLPSS